jgi:phosphatidylinositol glycan class F
VPALLSTLAPLAALQIAFVAVCLPPTGGTPTMRRQKPGEKKARLPGKLESGLNSKIVVCLDTLDSMPSMRYRMYLAEQC